MKRIIPVLALFALIGTACTKEIQENSPVSAQDKNLMTKLVGGSEGEIIAGSVLVKLDAQTTEKIVSGGFAEVSGEIFGDMDIKSFSPAVPVKPKNMEAARKYGLDRWFTVRFDENIRPDAIAERIASSSSVKAVQYSRFAIPVSTDEVYPCEDYPVTRAATKAEAPFNNPDPYFQHQWNLYNDGTVAEKAVAGADAGVKDAWRLTGGDPSVIVAVLDCGLAYDHEDLKDAMWINESEVKDNEKDDDNNGYVDDIYGFNFVNCLDITGDSISDKSGAVSNDEINYKTQSGHGTHVAGIIGATNGNGKGISSVAGGTGNNDGVRLMSCQIFDYDRVFGLQNATVAQIAAAYIYAADNGACIAQCSYGYPEDRTNNDMYINGGTNMEGKSLEYAAIQYFLDRDNSNHECLEGNIIVFSAGNTGKAYSMYPGALSEVLSVTSIGYDFLPGGYTHYGPGCKIAAPGGEMRQEKGHNESMILSLGYEGVAVSSPELETGQSGKSSIYVYMHGTSMACPHVSGVLALGISYAKKLGKRFTREDMTSMLLTSTDDIDHYLVSGKKDYYDASKREMVYNVPLEKYYKKMGTGLVDAWKFLMAVEGTPSVIVKAGAKSVIDLDKYCNPSGTYEISVDDDSAASLGLSGNPVIRNGKLEIECGKVGAGKIVLSSSVGRDTAVEGGIGSMNYSREISIVSREFATNNGGWL